MERDTYRHPPWPAAAAALIAFAALALSSGAALPLAGLGVALLASYAFLPRFENAALTKWTLRIIVIGMAVFGYLLGAVKDDNAFLDMRYPYSFALAAASELTLQFWRREPTGGPRAPLSVLLSALVFVVGCTVPDDPRHVLWALAPAYFLFFTLALPAFRAGVRVPFRPALLPVLLALGLGGASHAALYTYRSALNALGNPAFAGRRTSAAMGMSGQPILGSSFTLRDSLARVLRVRHLGPDPYLRGMSFDTYQGHTWGPPLENRGFLAYRPQSRPARGGFFTRLDTDAALLFAPLHSAALRPDNDIPLEWAQQTNGPVRTAANASEALAYTAVPEGDGAGLFDAPPTQSEQARDLAVPAEVDPQVTAKARQIGGGLQRPQDKISAVIRFLHQNNRYSLTVAPGPGEPVSDFILHRRAAHCEYFASAATLLLRGMGVPTRYVSGYFAWESDGTGMVLVRQRDAHAWAESWVPGTGWITVDATPAGGRPDSLAGAVPWWWRVWEGVQDVLGAIRRWVLDAGWAEKGAVFGLLVLGLLVPQAVRWAQRRRAALGFQYSRPDAALTALAVRFERLLVRRGVPCPAERPWAEHVRAWEAARRPAAEAFVRRYDRARFGPAPGPGEVARLDTLLRALEKEKR